nr:uncharacterized protein LOC109150827 [Ipomoea batatas]
MADLNPKPPDLVAEITRQVLAELWDRGFRSPPVETQPPAPAREQTRTAAALPTLVNSRDPRYGADPHGRPQAAGNQQTLTTATTGPTMDGRFLPSTSTHFVFSAQNQTETNVQNGAPMVGESRQPNLTQSGEGNAPAHTQNTNYKVSSTGHTASTFATAHSLSKDANLDKALPINNPNIATNLPSVTPNDILPQQANITKNNYSNNLPRQKPPRPITRDPQPHDNRSGGSGETSNIPPDPRALPTDSGNVGPRGGDSQPPTTLTGEKGLTKAQRKNLAKRRKRDKGKSIIVDPNNVTIPITQVEDEAGTSGVKACHQTADHAPVFINNTYTILQDIHETQKRNRHTRSASQSNVDDFYRDASDEDSDSSKVDKGEFAGQHRVFAMGHGSPPKNTRVPFGGRVTRSQTKERLRDPLWAELYSVSDKVPIGVPWSVVGDFNCLLNVDEKRGGLPYPHRKTTDFRECNPSTQNSIEAAEDTNVEAFSKRTMDLPPVAPPPADEHDILLIPKPIFLGKGVALNDAINKLTTRFSSKKGERLAENEKAHKEARKKIQDNFTTIIRNQEVKKRAIRDYILNDSQQLIQSQQNQIEELKAKLATVQDTMEIYFRDIQSKVKLVGEFILKI